MTTIVPIVTIGFDIPENVEEKPQETYNPPSILSDSNSLQVEPTNTPRKLTHDLDDPEEHAQFSKALEEMILHEDTEQKVKPDFAPSVEENPATHINTGSLRNPTKKKPEDFEFGEIFGTGTFSQVRAATEKETGKLWAAKIIIKQQILKLEQRSVNQRKQTISHTRSYMDSVLLEKRVLDMLAGHPNITTLYCTFQDAEHLYFILEYCPNGELLDLIKKAGRFDEVVASFYAAEIVCALEFMHEKNIIHRDLKPENILLDPTRHLKISDFGTAEILTKESNDRAVTFIGTAEYICPELLTQKWANKMSDVWALGCIIFQMLVGKVPFRGETEFLTFTLIKELKFAFPEFISNVAKDLISKLLNPDPSQRLGANGYQEIKKHPFFNNVKWENLPSQFPPPIKYMRSNSNGVKSTVKTTTQEREEKLKAQKSSPWGKFLFDDELIIHNGPVWKKKGGIYLPRKRQLIITDYPRIIYIDIEKMQQKGEIPWSSKIVIKCQNEKRFSVKVPGRTYFLEDISGKSFLWYDAITKLLDEHQAV